MRADKYFAEKFGSRTKAAEALEKGLVLVNGRTPKPKEEIRETDEIVLSLRTNIMCLTEDTNLQGR